MQCALLNAEIFSTSPLSFYGVKIIMIAIRAKGMVPPLKERHRVAARRDRPAKPSTIVAGCIVGSRVERGFWVANPAGLAPDICQHLTIAARVFPGHRNALSIMLTLSREVSRWSVSEEA